MSIHIKAEDGQIAEVVLLPGDPLRAKWIADQFLQDVRDYSGVRGVYVYTGFTGSGKEVSVMGSNMGMPNIGTYCNELHDSYGVEVIIRVGSCGAMQPDMKLRDVVIAQGACSDSGMQTERFGHRHFAPIADFNLLYKTYEAAKLLNIPVRVGNVFATDMFYNKVNPNVWKHFANYGVLAIEMETAELYTVSAESKFKALTILQVSDHLITSESLSAEEREKSFVEMIQIILKMLQ